MFPINGFLLALAGALLSILGAVFLRNPSYCSPCPDSQRSSSALAVFLLVTSLFMLVSASAKVVAEETSTFSTALFLAYVAVWIAGVVAAQFLNVSELGAKWLVLASTSTTTVWWLTRDDSLPLWKLLMTSGLLLWVFGFSRNILNRPPSLEGMEPSKEDQPNV